MNSHLNRKISALFAGFSFAAALPSFAEQSVPATLIANAEWGALMTPEGYSDVVLDLRPGFEGREYLSGEWGAAICFDGYILRTSATLEGEIDQDWSQLGVPRFIDVPRPGASRFTVPKAFIDTMPERNFFLVEAIFSD